MVTALTRSIVRASARAPWRTLLLAIAICVAAAGYAAQTLDFNTEPDALFAPDLPFRVAEDEFYRLFPGEADVILVVIDGPSTASSLRAADRLATVLSSNNGFFNPRRQPTGGAFFTREGPPYWTVWRLPGLSTTPARAPPPPLA